MASTQDTDPGFSVALGLSKGVAGLDPGDIQQFYFIEDIFSFCMVGKMIFKDSYGIIEKGPMTGNERLVLSYGDKLSRRLLFDIIKIDKITSSSGTLNSKDTQIAIHFVDTTFKYFTKKKFSKSWKDENTLDILKDVLKKCEGHENEKILLKRYDTPDTELNFVSPYWTPIEIMKWLNKRSIPKNIDVGKTLGGYLYYNNTYWDSGESSNQDNNFTAAWKGINNLFAYPSSSTDEKWIDILQYVFSGGPEDSTGDNMTYVNKVLDWNYGGIDFVNTRRLQGGHFLSYKFKGKELIDKTYKYTKENDEELVDYGMIDDITALGSKSLFVDISERDADITLDAETNGHVIKNMIFNDWMRNYSKQQSFSIIVRGWEERFAGKMIKDLYWPSMESNDYGGNKNMIGSFLIKSVTHNFGTKEGYKQRLVLLKNAYYQSDNDSLIIPSNINTSSGQKILTSV